MSLLTGLSPNPGKPCRVGILLLELNETDSTILAGALRDGETWSPRALAKALGERGITLSKDTIVSHRTGVCKCSRI
jgi:hypothetical protein